MTKDQTKMTKQAHMADEKSARAALAMGYSSFTGHPGLLIRHVPALLVLAGCGSHKAPPPPTSTTPPPPEERWMTTPISVPPSPIKPVREGSSPLVYLVESAVTVRIVDATSGQELLKVPVPARTIISVNAQSGVQVGGATMKLGPLPADHRFAIYLESSQENYSSQGYIRPGQSSPSGFPPPAPATQTGGTP